MLFVQGHRRWSTFVKVSLNKRLRLISAPASSTHTRSHVSADRGTDMSPFAQLMSHRCRNIQQDGIFEVKMVPVPPIQEAGRASHLLQNS